MKHRLIIGLMTVALSGGLLTTGYTQPDPHEPATKANPANQDAEAIMRKALEAGMQLGLKMARMTPQEQQQELQKLLQQGMRMSLDRAKFTDKTLQDTILQFVAEQDKARLTVRIAANKVYLAEEPRGVVVDNPTLETEINAYLAAIEDVKAERENAIAALDQKIGFSQNPHLKGWLLLNGVIGDAAWFTGNTMMAGSMVITSLAGLQNNAVVAPHALPRGNAAPAVAPHPKDDPNDKLAPENIPEVQVVPAQPRAPGAR